MKKLLFLVLLVGVFFGQDSLNMSFKGSISFPDTNKFLYSAILDYQDGKVCMGNMRKTVIFDVSDLDSLDVLYQIVDNYDINSDAAFVEDTILGVLSDEDNLSFFDLNSATYSQISSNSIIASSHFAIVDSFVYAYGLGSLNIYEIDSTYGLSLLDSLWIPDAGVFKNLTFTGNHLILNRSSSLPDMSFFWQYSHSSLDSIELVDTLNQIDEYTFATETINDSMFAVSYYADGIKLFKVTDDSLFQISSFPADSIVSPLTRKIAYHENHIFGVGDKVIYGLDITDLDSIFCDCYYRLDSTTVFDICPVDSFLYCYSQAWEDSDSLSLKIFKWTD